MQIQRMMVVVIGLLLLVVSCNSNNGSVDVRNDATDSDVSALEEMGVADIAKEDTSAAAEVVIEDDKVSTKDAILMDTETPEDMMLEDMTPGDTGMMDTGMMDTGMMDTGMMDTGMMDTGMMDMPADIMNEDMGLPACPTDFVPCTTYTDATAVNADREILFGGTEGFKYNPKCIKIKVGQTVTFTGNFGFHPLSQVCGPEDVITNGSGTESIQFTFTLEGIYNYQCDVHFGPPNNMKGSIMVVP